MKNAVIVREEIQRISQILGVTLFLGVLDLKSCFPRICRERLLHLAAEVLSPSEWDLLCEIYHDTWGDIRIQGQRSTSTRGDIGTIEGGILSVQLLKLYLAVLLRMLGEAGFTAGEDFQVLTIKSGQVGVADDVLLWTWSADTLRSMLLICEDWSSKYRATFSAEKTQVVIQRAPGDETDYGSFFMYGEKLGVVDEAEHLGLPVCSSGENGEPHVRARLSKARRALHGSLSLYSKKDGVSAALKAEVWRKQIRPIATYGLDTVSLRPTDIKELEKFQLKML